VISDIQTVNISCLPPVRSAVSSLVNSLENEVEKALRRASVIASPAWEIILPHKNGVRAVDYQSR
jgi:hypothetical protein